MHARQAVDVYSVNERRVKLDIEVAYYVIAAMWVRLFPELQWP